MPCRRWNYTPSSMAVAAEWPPHRGRCYRWLETIRAEAATVALEVEFELTCERDDVYVDRDSRIRWFKLFSSTLDRRTGS